MMNNPKKRTIYNTWEETNIGRKRREWYPGENLHVMNRGCNHQTIFIDAMDYEYFLELIRITQEKYEFDIHAYCLMTNHYHLLIGTKDTNIATIMKQINCMYTKYFNVKYHRDGALFRGRYKSCEVVSDEYMLRVSRYINLNPVTARMVKKPEQYIWSSYRTYLALSDDNLTNCDKLLDYYYNNNCYLYKEFVEAGIKSDDYYEQIRTDIGEE